MNGFELKKDEARIQILMQGSGFSAGCGARLTSGWLLCTEPHRREAVSHRLKAPHPKSREPATLSMALEQEPVITSAFGFCKFQLRSTAVCTEPERSSVLPSEARPLPPLPLLSPSSSHSRRGGAPAALRRSRDRTPFIVVEVTSCGSCKGQSRKPLSPFVDSEMRVSACNHGWASADVPVTGSVEGRSTQKRRRCGGFGFLQKSCSHDKALQHFV